MYIAKYCPQFRTIEIMHSANWIQMWDRVRDLKDLTKAERRGDHRDYAYDSSIKKPCLISEQMMNTIAKVPAEN